MKSSLLPALIHLIALTLLPTLNRLIVALLLLAGCSSDPSWYLIPETAGIEIRSLEAEGKTMLAGTRDGRILTFVLPDADAPVGTATVVRELQGPLRGISDLATAGQTLWVTGPGGIAQRVEGRWVLTDSLAGEPLRVVFSVEAAKDGSLWFGANGGVIVVDGDRLDEQPWTPRFPHRVIHAAVRDASGTVWYAARTGLGSMHDGLMELHYPDINFGSVMEAHDGSLWFGTRGRGALRIQNGVHYWTGDDIDLFPVLQTAGGDVWAVSETEGVLRWEAEGWVQPWLRAGSATNRYFDVAEDAHGHIWLASAEGVFRLDSR